LEREWWNNNGSFQAYTQTLSWLNRWAKAQDPQLLTEEYIGWFKKPANKDRFMANELVKNSDRILVHAYQRNLSFYYIRDRLRYLGQAAMSQNRIFPVVVIFSAESEFSADYFRSHDFEDAFRIMQDGFKRARFAGKENIRLVGYQIFDYSSAKAAKERTGNKRR
jgi:hypothetical protein